VIGALVLAAGASSRFGSPKPIVRLRGEAAITRVCRCLNQVGIEDVAVVVGPHADIIAPEVPPPARIVPNPKWQQGRSSSIKAGVLALPPGIPLLVWPVDHPAVNANTIQRLQAAKGLIRIPTFDGRRGHPPLFDPSLRDEILALQDDQPLHDIVHNHADEVTEVPVPDPGVLLNMDRPDDLKKIDDFLRRSPDARPPS
jgi:molybdenum cofactor cytidylyltransferase